MERHAEAARKVVQSFRAILAPRALQEITADEFAELEILVHEALADELHQAAEQMGDLVQRLRAEVDMPQLGL